MQMVMQVVRLIAQANGWEQFWRDRGVGFCGARLGGERQRGGVQAVGLHVALESDAAQAEGIGSGGALELYGPWSYMKHASEHI